MAEYEEITREEFKEWHESKVTKHVMSMLGEIREQLKEFLANGGTISEDSPSTELVVGRIQGLTDFLNVEYEEGPEERREKYEY